MTDQKFVSEYFKEIDLRDEAVLKYINRKQPELISDMQDAINRYNEPLNNILPFDKLNVLHSKLRSAKENYTFYGYCKLFLDYTLEHKRVKYRDALFISLLVEYSIYQEEVKNYFSKQLNENHDFNEIIESLGNSVNNILASDAEYRIRKLMETGSDNKKVFKQAKDFMLKRYENGNYGGFLNLVSLIYGAEKYLKQLRQQGIEKVRFIAVLDNATTDICRSLDGQTFKVNRLVIGENMPPIFPPPHPCRSVVRPLTNPENRDIINTGGGRMTVDITGASGAIPRDDMIKMDEHAARYYEEIRKRTGDIESIAKNTGFSVDDVKKIKEHVFLTEHDLGYTEPRRFTPDYDIAVSWQRLIDGKNVQEMDIVLLNHELMEYRLMKRGLLYDEAHSITESTYNYKKYTVELDNLFKQNRKGPVK